MNEPAQHAPAIPGWRHIYSGKVRDLYVPDADEAPDAPSAAAASPSPIVLVVASDRVSAFDHVLPTVIPGKGEVLTAMTHWWFGQLADLIPSHEVPDDDPRLALLPPVPESLRSRSILALRLDMVPVECVVRGYLTGSGLAEYHESGSVCGIALPPGLVDGDELPEPIFTPARKAAVGDHDENVSFAVVVAEHGERLANQLRDASLAIYSQARDIALERGIILADTKFEFGHDPATGQLVLGDEVLTPDSSRFWDAALWAPGGAQPSFDKQHIRDWLASPSSLWDRISTPPDLPDAVVSATRARYGEALERLTGGAPSTGNAPAQVAVDPT